MIDLINMKKANKADLSATEELIENLNDRVKHISNLLQTLTSSILPIRNTIMTFDEHTKKKVLLQVKRL